MGKRREATPRARVTTSAASGRIMRRGDCVPRSDGACDGRVGRKRRTSATSRGGLASVREEENMRYQPLGRTGLFVSELCLGAMTFGGKGMWQAIGQLGDK